MGVNVSACTCVLDHLLCLGLTLSGGSPLYALIIHWQLLLAERNSTPRSFSPPLHFLSFSSSFLPLFLLPEAIVGPLCLALFSTGLFLPRSNLARVNYICYSARVNTRQSIKAEANRRRPAGRLEPLQGRQRRGRAGRHPVSGSPPCPEKLKRSHAHGEIEL